MARITMEKAEAIAKIEADKKFNSKISEARTHLSLIATEVFKSENTFPNFDQYLYDEQWIRSNSSVYLHYQKPESTSTKSETIMLIDFHYPTKCYSSGASLNDKEGKVLAAFRAWEKVKEERTKFLNKLERTIKMFTTDKKLLEQIPELSCYFQDMSTALTIVPTELIAEIRKGLLQ